MIVGTFVGGMADKLGVKMHAYYIVYLTLPHALPRWCQNTGHHVG